MKFRSIHAVSIQKAQLRARIASLKNDIRNDLLSVSTRFNVGSILSKTFTCRKEQQSEDETKKHDTTGKLLNDLVQIFLDNVARWFRK